MNLYLTFHILIRSIVIVGVNSLADALIQLLTIRSVIEVVVVVHVDLHHVPLLLVSKHKKYKLTPINI